MVLKDHLSALLWKNWLLWKRSLFFSICEILFPILLFLAIYGLRSTTASKDIDAESYAVPNNLGRNVGQIIVPSVDKEIFQLLSTSF